MLIHPKKTRALDARVDETLDHAAAAPFYRKRWPRRVTSSGLTRLQALPLVNKEDAAEFQADLIVDGVPPNLAGLEAGVVSSSTTRTGRPLRILRSPAEFSQPLVAQHAPDDDTPPPIAGPTTLQLFSPKHGMRVPSPDRILLPAVLHPNTIDVLVDVWTSHRTTLSALVAPLAALKWMTVALIERGSDPGKLGIEAIGTTGYPLTQAARNWLEDAWMCPLFDNFSLSEVPGFATECEACGAFHWDGDGAVLEICSLDDDVTKKGAPPGGVGELVITTLVPSVLRMPLIRYRTGDLVKRTPRCSTSGGHGFAWLGRRAHSIVHDNSVVVGSKALLEFGESHPEIAQHPHPAERLETVPSSDLGVPKILVVDGKIAAELRFDPARFPSRAAALAVALRQACVKRVAGAPPVTLELTRPGTLDLSQHARKL